MGEPVRLDREQLDRARTAVVGRLADHGRVVPGGVQALDDGLEVLAGSRVDGEYLSGADLGPGPVV